MLWTIPAKFGPKPTYSPWLQRAHEELNEIVPAEPLNASGMSQILTFAAKSLQEAARRMVKSRFKDLVKQAIRRKVILEMRKGTLRLSSKERSDLQRRCVALFYGFQEQPETPNVPDTFIESFTTLVAEWKSPFQDLLAYASRTKALDRDAENAADAFKQANCKLSGNALKKALKEDATLTEKLSEIRQAKAELWKKRQSSMMAFQLFMHQLRREDVNAMEATAANPIVVKLHKDTERAFWSASKCGLLLPLSSYEVKSIRLDKAGLKELLSSLPEKDYANLPKKKRKGAPGSSADDPPKKKPKGTQKPSAEVSWDDSLKDEELFLNAFPGLLKVLKHNRGKKDDPKWFGGSLCTNGVSVSLFMHRTGRSTDASEPLEDEDAEEAEKKVSVKPFIQSGKRLVAIDPGMRDVITAVALDIDTGQVAEGSKNTLSLSNRAYTRSSWRKRTQVLTSSEQKKIRLDEDCLARYKARRLVQLKPKDGELKRNHVQTCSKVNLAEYIGYTPLKDTDLDSWKTYLLYNLPVMRLRIESFRALCIRQAKFTSRKRTDAFLDKVCKDIISLGVSKADLATKRPKGEDVLVAFGDAKTASGGFGYSSTAQGRLKHRLAHVHGCFVCPVDEYLTSQMCSICEEKLFFVGVHSIEEQQKTATRCRMQNKKPPMYGVLKCPHCKSSNASEGTFPKKHWHRDINASINIGKAYLFAARNGGTERPSYLKRPEKVIA
jgi:hypothetical protein